MLISVVVPLYNEEAVVPELARSLDRMRSALAGPDRRIEFVLVDDGSNDGTAWELALAFRGRSDVRVVGHHHNLGFGAALRSGVEESRGSVVVCYDGDSPYPPEDAALLVEAVQGPEDADAATVSPWASGGRADGVGPMRRLLSRTASLLYRVALRGRGQGLTCFTASYRAYKGDVVRGLEWNSDGFLATAEVLTLLLRRGHRVIELPATLRRRSAGASKMRVLRNAWGHLGLLVRVTFSR